jgi:hypothetical protein
MIVFTLALGSLALWGAVAAVRGLTRDGYRATPTRPR